MRTYAAIATLSSGDRSAFAAAAYPHILYSFHYHGDIVDLPAHVGYPITSAVVDSGAFSVWTKGATIDLDGYIAWCLTQRSILPEFRAINLDVIPGTVDGGAPTKADRSRSIDESVANADRMRQAGLKVTEVFHWHEPIDYLDELLDRRQVGEVLGIGGLAGHGSIVAKDRFVSSVFRRLIDRYDLAVLPPLHGLGVSHVSRLARQYPWWSIDSSAWAAGVKFGLHITKRGKQTRTSDTRTAVKSVRRLYVQRVLDGWQRDDRDLSRIWEARGVIHAP